MAENQQAKFEGWAIVDVMGHQRYIGYVTTEAYGQAVLFRIDVPALDWRERVTRGPEYCGPNGSYVPAGSTVKEGPVAGYSKLVGSGSIYTITPCTKEAALFAVERSQSRPLMQVTLPEGRTLVAADAPDDDDVDDVDDDDVDESDARAEPETPGEGGGKSL